MVPIQHEYARAQAAVDALAGETGSDAERAAVPLRIVRQALEEIGDDPVRAGTEPIRC
jgi:hypothetical protein